MIGIVLASHGRFAEGVKDVCEMLFGDAEQIACVSLMPGQSPEDFQAQMENAAVSVDTGEGAIILCDVLGGTPSNRAAFLMSKYQVISGINMAVVLELLGQRMVGDIDIPALLDIGREGIAHMNHFFGLND